MLVLCLPLMGCGEAEPQTDDRLSVEADADTDADSDTDSDSDTDTGTDTGPRDTDGDGWTDAEEAASYTDGDDASDHPYTGGWEIDSCRSSITSTGAAVGDTAPDFALSDQYGDPVRLHDFCDKLVLLDFGTQWCGTCQAKAPTVATWQATYGPYGFLAVTAQSENTSYATPTTADLLAWDKAYSSGHPVVADPSGSVDATYDPHSSSRPTYVLIGPGMEILSIGGSSSVKGADIEAALPTPYP